MKTTYPRQAWEPEFYEDLEPPATPHQYQIEFAALLEHYELIAPSKILEIGCHLGGSLYQFIKRLHPGATAVAVDLPGGAWGQAGLEYVYYDWAEYAKKYGVELVTFLANSHDPQVQAELGAYAPFDFVFIDGDHTLDGVTQDWELARRYTRAGSIIAFHDILQGLDPGIGVPVLWESIRRNGFIIRELYSSREQDAMGIGVVFI